MRPSEVEAFDHFWRYVRQFENHVCELGGNDVGPDVEYLWDEAFENAYEAIRSPLKGVSRKQWFELPGGPDSRELFVAETAHQAVMFILNPPEALFPYAGCLGSSAYGRIKRAGQDELRELIAGSKTSNPEPSADASVVLITEVRRYHVPEGQPAVTVPLTQRQWGKILGVSPSTVHRMFKRHWPRGEGFKGYQRWCLNPFQFARGERNVDADGRFDVDGVDDGKEDEDDECGS